MSRPIQSRTGFGGAGGSAWDDKVLEHKPTVVGIRKIEIRSGNQVDSLQVTYLCADGSLYKAPRHGGSGGSASTITLANDERIWKVEGKTNNVLIDQLTFFSKRPDGTERMYGPYGVTGRTPFAVEGYILGFCGRAGNLLDGLGVYYLAPLVKSKDKAGGSGGRPFDDKVDSLIPPVIGIRSMVVRSGNQIDSIQSTFLQLGGSLLEGSVNGGSGGAVSVVQLEDDEVIVRMEGKTNGQLVDQFTLHTISQGTSQKYGPFGKTGQNVFEFQGRILGFHGTAGNLMDSIGVYSVQNERM